PASWSLSKFTSAASGRAMGRWPTAAATAARTGGRGSDVARASAPTAALPPTRLNANTDLAAIHSSRSEINCSKPGTSDEIIPSYIASVGSIMLNFVRNSAAVMQILPALGARRGQTAGQHGLIFRINQVGRQVRPTDRRIHQPIGITYMR